MSSAGIYSAVALSLAVFSSGCFAMRPASGMDGVEQLVRARTAADIHWKRGAASDDTVLERVRALLNQELTALTAVQIALLNNRSLQATFERLGIAQADVAQAGLMPNPVVHAGLRLGVGGPGPGAELSLIQDFISAIQIPLRKRVAGASFEAAKMEVAEAVINLAAGVKIAFYATQSAEQMLEMRRTIAQAFAVAAEAATRQHEAANITDLDWANERASYEQAKLDLARADVDVLSKREELNALLGVWGRDTTWTMSKRLPTLPSEDPTPHGLESLAVTQRLDLAAARANLNVAAQTLGLTRFQALVPSGALGVDSEREPDGEWTLGPAIELPLIIFDQGQAAVAGGAARLRESEEQYASLAVQIRSQVRRAALRMMNARAMAEHHTRVILPLRHHILEQTQLEYNAMQIGIYQLLQAKRDEIEAGASYIEALADYWTARAELERAVGGDLPVDAAPPRASAPSPEPAVAPATHGDHRHHGGSQ